MSDQQDTPMLQVVHGGTPSDEEVAALAVVLSAVAAHAAETPEPGRPGRGWAAPDTWQSIGRRPGTRTKAAW